jgi:hypothetical protein
MFKLRIGGLFGMALALAAPLHSPAAGTTAAVTEPSFVYDAAKQAVRMQLPGGTTVIATLFQPAAGKTCGRAKGAQVDTIAITDSDTPSNGFCVDLVGVVVPPQSGVDEEVAAVGGWAQSITLVYQFDRQIKTIQVDLPVGAP